MLRRNRVGTGVGVGVREILLIAAVLCFGLAALTFAGTVSVAKVDWTDLGLLLGFLAFLVPA